MNQSQFLAITCNSPEAREISRVHGAIGFGFASHWLKNWRESFKPITKRSNRNHVITFDSHLKTAPYKFKEVASVAKEFRQSRTAPAVEVFSDYSLWLMSCEDCGGRIL